MATNKKGIVWLASYPRSGNTWLRFFLHSLIELLHGVPESNIIVSDIARHSVWESEKTNYAAFLTQPAEADLESVCALRPLVQKSILDRETTSVFVKTHLVLGRFHGTPTINAAITRGAVYLIRDPRDVAVSYAAHIGTSIDEMIAIMANPSFVAPHGVWEIVGSWSSNVRSWAFPAQPPILVIRYEDMVERPVKAFSRIVNHVGIKASQLQIKKAARLSEFKGLQRQEVALGLDGWSPSGKPFFRQGRAGSWREQLTPAQARKIETDHGELMKHFGYL